MHNHFRHIWADRLDKFCAITGALLPVEITVGNVGFESLIGIEERSETRHFTKLS